MGWVYFIQHGGPEGAIKIGTTSGNPHARLRALQTGAPEPLQLLAAVPGDARLERELHWRFEALRVRDGGEWFRADLQLLAFVDGVRAAQVTPIDDGSDLPSPVHYAQAAAALAVTRVALGEANAAGFRGPSAARLGLALEELEALRADGAWAALEELVSANSSQTAEDLVGGICEALEAAASSAGAVH